MNTRTRSSKIIKVDRIHSVGEASEFDNLGVDIVSVSFSDEIRFIDRRKVTEKQAIEIRKALKYAKVCGQISFQDFNTQSCLNLIETFGMSYVQIPFPEIPPLNFRQKLKEMGVGLIYAGLEASYEDDPSWILSRLENIGELNAAYFQIELLPIVQNSWHFFTTECPKYPEELQIEDINDLAKINPFLASVDLNSNNILEVIEKLHQIRGIGLTLGTLTSNQYSPHTLEFDRAIELVKILRSPVGEATE